MPGCFVPNTIIDKVCETCICKDDIGQCSDWRRTHNAELKSDGSHALERPEHFRCPNCAKELIEGTPRRYETLSEHCSDPNKETYPIRRTYKCANPECFYYDNGWWNCEAGYYGSIRGMGKHEFSGACYEGFCDEAVYESFIEMETERPHLLPKPPLLRKDYCKKLDEPCDRKCLSCFHFNRPVVEEFFKKFEGVKWFKGSE